MYLLLNRHISYYHYFVCLFVVEIGLILCYLLIILSNNSKAIRLACLNVLQALSAILKKYKSSSDSVLLDRLLSRFEEISLDPRWNLKYHFKRIEKKKRRLCSVSSYFLIKFFFVRQSNQRRFILFPFTVGIFAVDASSLDRFDFEKNSGNFVSNHHFRRHSDVRFPRRHAIIRFR